MKRLFSREQMLTVPNLLSLLRLLLIPLILFLYCKKAYGAAVLVVFLSAVTDIVDGTVARKCGKVTDLGKILDPVADKLTQGSLLICLSIRYRLMRLFLILFAVKELLMVLMGSLTLKRQNRVNSAQWHGKLATALIYGVTALLILLPGIPAAAANGLILLAMAAMLFSFASYTVFYFRLLSDPS